MVPAGAAASVGVAELVQLLRLRSAEEVNIPIASDLSKLDWGNCSLSEQAAAMPAIIARLARMLDGSSQAAQQAAAVALAVAAEEGWQEHTAASPAAVAGLVRLLRSSSHSVQLAAAEALCNLVRGSRALK
jgi:hypothetical protein